MSSGKQASIMIMHDELCQVFNGLMTALSLQRAGAGVTIFFGSRGINAVHQEKVRHLVCLPDQPEEEQKKVLARYPVHWHLSGPVTNQYVKNSSIWKTFNRCVTIHGTDQVQLVRNVCHDHIGHGIFLEDGAERGNVIEGNLVLTTRQPATGEQLLASDATPASFWITNPDNVVRGNHAAGSRGFGFWSSHAGCAREDGRHNKDADHDQRP